MGESRLCWNGGLSAVIGSHCVHFHYEVSIETDWPPFFCNCKKQEGRATGLNVCASRRAARTCSTRETWIWTVMKNPHSKQRLTLSLSPSVACNSHCIYQSYSTRLLTFYFLFRQREKRFWNANTVVDHMFKDFRQKHFDLLWRLTSGRLSPPSRAALQ